MAAVAAAAIVGILSGTVGIDCIDNLSQFGIILRGLWLVNGHGRRIVHVFNASFNVLRRSIQHHLGAHDWMVCDEVTAASAVEAERGIGLVVESLGYDVQRVGGDVSGDGWLGVRYWIRYWIRYRRIC